MQSLLHSGETFLDTLVHHSVFLTIMLPLIGVVLVWNARLLGVQVVRQTAIINALLTALFSLIVLCNYQTPTINSHSNPQVKDIPHFSAGSNGYPISLVGEKTNHL